MLSTNSLPISPCKYAPSLTKAVALGDLSKPIEVDAQGGILGLKNTVNGMVVRLRAQAAEVTRVTLEVGSQSKLGGQAHVPDIEGVWFKLVRNVSYYDIPLPKRVQFSLIGFQYRSIECAQV